MTSGRPASGRTFFRISRWLLSFEGTNPTTFIGPKVLPRRSCRCEQICQFREVAYDQDLASTLERLPPISELGPVPDEHGVHAELKCDLHIRLAVSDVGEPAIGVLCLQPLEVRSLGHWAAEYAVEECAHRSPLESLCHFALGAARHDVQASAAGPEKSCDAVSSLICANRRQSPPGLSGELVEQSFQFAFLGATLQQLTEQTIELLEARHSPMSDVMRDDVIGDRRSVSEGYVSERLGLDRVGVEKHSVAVEAPHGIAPEHRCHQTRHPLRVEGHPLSGSRDGVASHAARRSTSASMTGLQEIMDFYTRDVNDSQQKQVVLCVANKPLLPDFTGSRRRIVRLVEHLAETNRVHLVLMTRESVDEGVYVQRLGVEAVHHVSPEVNRASRVRRTVEALLRGRMLDMAGLDVVALTQRFEGLVEVAAPDVVWLSGHWAMPFAKAFDVQRVVVDFQHAERATQSRLAKSIVRHPRPILRQALTLLRVAVNWFPATRQETSSLRRADVITVCSPDDVSSLTIPAGASVVLVPNGVDIIDRLPVRPNGNRVLLVGDLHYPPNQEAARLVVHEIAPRLAAQLPTVHVDLVGVVPSDISAELSTPLSTVHGIVESLRPWYQDAAIVIAPIFSGSGTRTKILEAFAHGVPVVTTSMGIEGIEIQPGVEVSLGESMPDLIWRSVEILSDDGLWMQRAVNAKAIVDSRYSWRSSGRVLVDTIEALADGASQPEGAVE